MRWIDLYARWVWHPGKWRVARSLRLRDAGRGPVGVREVVRAGLRWRLDPLDAVAQDLYWCGVKDKWELHHIRGLVPRDATIIDIGANFGYYACVLAAQMVPSGRVFAFEPCPATFERLRTNIALNNLDDRVTAIACGVSDHEGTCAIQEDRSNSGANHLVEHAGEIRLTTLDRFCESQGVNRIDFLKIDVEGLEMQVLRGGEAAIRRYQPMMQVEVHPSTLKRQGASPDELINCLRNFGYTVNRISRKRLIPLDATHTIDGYFNVLCLPQS